MKKIFITLTILIFTLLVNSSFAYGFTDITDDKCKEAVNVLSAYNIITGYDADTFRPYDAVTRAQMAKILTTAAGYSDYTQNMTSSYEDMKDHWASKYVDLANALNIVNGTSENTFEPDKNITYSETLTMVLRLLGYTDTSLPGDWPTNYYKKATEIGLLDNTRLNSTYIHRQDVAIIVYNALSCDLVKTDRKSTPYSTGKTLLSLLGSKKTEEITTDHLKLDNGFDYTNYVFNIWDAYYDISGTPVYMYNPQYKELSGVVTSVMSNKVIFAKDYSGNVEAFKIPDKFIVFNGALGNAQSLENAEIKIVYSGDTIAESTIGAIAYNVTDTILIDNKNIYSSGDKTFAGKYLPITSNLKINTNKIKVYGDASSLEQIKIDDLVYFYETAESSTKKSSLSLEVVRQKVSGMVTKTEGQDNTASYTVDGKVYNAGKHFIFTEMASVSDTVDLILDKDGNIVKLTILSYGKIPVTRAIVLSSTDGMNNIMATIKILDEYGVTKTYSLADNCSVITKIVSGSNVQYVNSLKRNDFIKYDPVSQGNLKIVNRQPASLITSYYDAYTKTISSVNFKVTDNTFIVYETGSNYTIIKSDQLDSYLEGRICGNYLGNAEFLYISKGLKVNIITTTPVTPSITPPAGDKNYSEYIYGIINSAEKIDANNSNVTFFNYNKTFKFPTSTASNIDSYKNSFVRAYAVNGVITSISVLTPETDKTVINSVYSNQLKIDGITYMEYSNNANVYICTLNSAGEINSVKTGSKSDIKSGATVQLYDSDGSFDGVIDMILIFK